ncbi:SPFH domain-containing protein [Paraliomyxa miuraensis]|uniref:SPFH domain-containing protein n=1 Tax=Paraliomyxa miuraensis TaxID=376150 RepID=UPI00224D3284|nr:SPFH domain-containing protein [Paraliomyxa miuraensis]MCX4244887.1 SPFH domain-containing protein [Paraliomyxa miuraensis]
MQIIKGGRAVRSTANGLLQKLRGGSGGTVIWLVLAFVISMVLLFSSWRTIEPGQVAVRVNNITGEQEARTQPGLILCAPFGIHSVYIIDASPQTFVMKGNKNVDALHVEELTVRASDGSNFLFNDTTIIFQVLGASAIEVVRDAGPEGEFRRWMRPFARAILRDEFGRESTISVSNPAKFGEATERARSRLNELLEPHGISVTKIVTPRPRFNEQYESLIEARNEAENQLTVIESELQRSRTDRERTLAEVDRDQNKVIQEKRAGLEAALASALAVQADTRRKADTYRIQTVAQGQAAKSAAERQAEELEGQLAADYEAKRATIDAFKTQPVERVMERLGEKLDGVTIDIQPWADDSTPSRLRVEQTGAVQ